MRSLALCALSILAGLGAALDVDAADAWAALAQPGAIVLIRHANAPGVGDPPGFRLDDCATQRNLDAAGREEARRLGERFRGHGIRVGAVLASQWCRTRETAKLAFGKGYLDDPLFNSFFGRPQAERDTQTARAKALLAKWKGPGALVVVTHQVNIQALTGVPTSTAQGVVVKPDGDRLDMVGTLTE